MCGRYTLSSQAELPRFFEVIGGDTPLFSPRWNIAPSQVAPVVRAGANGRELVMMKWGLIPSWAEDPAVGNRMINARGETAHEKPAFRVAFQRRRCLVPASGFYEWRKLEKGKQPYLLRTSSPLFAMAGLWERWVSPAGEEIESYTILTTSPNEVAARVHNRMPVILAPSDFDLWLNTSTPIERVMALMKPFEAEPMSAVMVSTLVNSPSNDRPECAQPIPDGKGGLF